jgi:hypothetical protein
MENQLIKVCRVCEINTSEDHKFRSKVCIKCCSKKNNEKLKQQNYYNKYYLDHKIQGLKRGRPPKIKELKI